MQERLGKLGISEESINASVSRPDLYGNDIVVFIKNSYEKIAKEQQELYNYIREIIQHSDVENALPYCLGVSLTYGMLSQSHTKNALTANEINAMRATIAEHITFKEGNESEVDLSWFTDKLRDDSSIFVDWLKENVDKLTDADAKATFIFGVVHIAMPFLMREEAKGMDKIFFKED